MRGTALLLLCVIAAQATQPQLTLSGKICNCNAAEAANVCSQNGSDNELIVHENCNQFYKCTHGQPIPYYCPDTTMYNPLAEICDWPHNVECGDRPIVAPGGGADGDDCSQEDSNNGNDGNGEDNGGSDNGNGGTCNCNPGEAPGICAADGSDGTLVAHENCNQFYKCDHGVPVTINCPPGLLYNPYTEQCDWPNKVECGDRPIVEIEGGGDSGGDVDCEDTGNGNGESGGGGNGDNGGGESGGGGTCNCNPDEAPGICAAEGSDGTLVAHENCNQFYKCAHGVPEALFCYGNLVYNPYIEQCDWPHNVDCGDKPIVEIDGGGSDGGDEDCEDNNGNGESGSGGGNGDNGGGDNGGTCNCNPGEAPGICAADGSDGILVAHENCNQFYKCNHGVPVTISCPPGLVYNPYIECCDWPYNVDCGDKPIVEVDGGGDGGSDGNNSNEGGNGDSGNGNGGNSNEDNGGTCNCNPEEAPEICSADGSDGTLVAHENCNQFYKCNHGVPVTMSCPPGLVYNPYIDCCDWPANVDCGDKPIVEVEGGGNGDNGGGTDNGGTENGGTDNGGTDNGGGTCNCNPGEAPGICAADGSDGTLVAHENCNQFYKCNHGVPVTISCPPGLVYNPYIECCDWPYNVDCGDKPIVEVDGGGDGGSDGNNSNEGGNGDSGNGNGGNSNEDNGGTCNCNPEEAPEICSADGSDGTLVAHENCNQFYKCNHGVPVTMSCPPGLVYNPYIDCCDWPANVDCGDKPIVEVEGGGNGDNGGGTDNGGTDNGGTDNGGTDNGGGTCNCNPGEAPGICAADGSDGVLVAHENCNQFYKCAYGVPVALNCPPGLLYNPNTEQCDWPQNVDCGDRPIGEIDGGDNGGTDNGGTDNGGTDNGGTDNGGTDNGGTDNGGGTCNCNPGEAPGICAADGSDGVLVAHENCNQFYKCAYGVPVALNCPSGLLYNPNTEQCDWPQNVDCGDRPIVEIDGGDNGGTDNGGTDNGGTDNGGTDNGGSDNGGGSCNCNPGEAPGICAADGSDGVLVAHENCNQFYKCSYGVPVALNCPSGLLYNPYIEQCDWPQNVDCGDKPIGEIDGGDNGGIDNGGTDNGGTDNGGTDNGGSDNGGTDNGGTDNGGGTCNCNPGEAPGICAADGSDGVLVAHENCNQFYKCSYGVPVALNCPPGLLYNPYIEQCDWPQNVDCGDKPIGEIDGGDNGGTDNGGTDNGGTDNGGTDNGGTDNGGTDNGGTDNGGGTCNCNPGEAPGICAADGSDGVLVAHENCNQFYKCAYGVPVALNCPPGLLYNPHTEQCDWPQNVECGDRPIVEIDGGDNGGTDNGGTDNGGTDNGGTDNGGSDNGGTDNGGTDNGGTDNGGGTCNCNPGEAPGICAADGSDGVLVAHENCNQFYKCSYGVPVALNCPPGLLYNPYIEQCDWPQNVDCGDKPIGEIDGGDNGGTDNGGTDNGGTDSGGTDNGGSDNGGTDNGGTDNGGTDNGGGTCNCNPGEAPGICAADGSDGVLVAHENCNQFYKCSYGVPVALNCPPGLLYNPYIEQCDWPQNVDCGDKPIGEIDGGDNGGTDNGGTDNGGTDNGGTDNGGTDNGGTDNGGTDNGGGTCNCNPGEAPGICAADGSDGVLVAHENCNQFYKCAYGVPVALNCPPGLLYNPNTEQCDWPQNVDCGDRPIGEIDGGDNGGTDNGGTDNGGTDNGGTDNGGSDNGGTDNGGTDNGGGTCNCNPGEAPGICAADGSDGVLVAHENCNQFYKCSYGVPVALNCPPGLLYNPYIEQCDWPQNVDCGDKPIGEIDGGDNGGTDNGGTDNGGTDNGGTDNGGTDNGGTDNGGTDNGGGTCNCNPGEAPGICAADGSDGVLVAHENCNQFYKCSYGVPVALNCPPGLLYNPHTEQCDWPQNVECGDRPIVEIDGGDNGGTDNGGTDNGGTDNGGSDNGGTDNGGGTCNCNPGEAPGICAADGSDGVLVAHENCNQFYKCSYGVPVALNCPPGLLYNPYIEQCDWPQNVNCGDRPVVEVDGGDSGGMENGGTDNGGTDNGGTDNGGNDNGNGDGDDNSCNCNPEEASGICAAPGSDGQFVAHENCNQFYQCAHGVPVCNFCPGTLLYNPYTQRCDWPHNVDCGDRPIVENEGGSEDSGDNDNDSNENDNEVSCNCNPEEAPGICSASGSDGTQVAHENCNQFYVCAHGLPVAVFCSNGLVYDPYTGRCNWPSVVDCGNRPIVENEGGGEDSDDNGSSEDANCDPSQAPTICAAPGSDGVLVAHENCNQFYVCTHGAPFTFDCPSNLLFNPNIRDCDWPQNVDCGDRVIPEPDSGDNGPCNCNAREAPSICAGRDSNGKMIAHEDCSQYYVCVEGVPVARSCPRTLFYEPHTQQCLWPTSVSCEGRTVTTYSSLNKHAQARRGIF